MNSATTQWAGLMPSKSSTIAGEVDALFYFILIATAIVFAIVVSGLVLFSIRYRRRTATAPLTSGKAHDTKLEIIWTVIPTILVIILFFWGFNVYLKMRVVPRNAMEIKVTGRQWFWVFDYPDGTKAMNELVVPAGKPVRLLLSSEDVIHSFYIPAFRIKMDALPNRYTETWFEATQTGTFDIFCAEYCGKGHSEMTGLVKVLTPEDYTAWRDSSLAAVPETTSPVDRGRQLFSQRACNTCHTIDGAPMVGPTFKNLYGHTVTLEGGSSVTADENYIRRSILEPKAEIVSGFQPVMPTYQGLLNDRDIDALVAYIKSLKDQKDE